MIPMKTIRHALQLVGIALSILSILVLIKLFSAVYSINNIDLDEFERDLKVYLEESNAFPGHYSIIKNESGSYFTKTIGCLYRNTTLNLQDPRKKIIIYGGSSVGCQYQLGDAFVKQFNSDPKLSSEYIALNLGQGGRDSRSAVALFNDISPILKPKIVLVYMGHNDIMNPYFRYIVPSKLAVSPKVPLLREATRYIALSKAKKMNLSIPIEDVARDIHNFRVEPRLLAALTNLGVISRKKIEAIDQRYIEVILSDYESNINLLNTIIEKEGGVLTLITVLRNLEFPPNDYNMLTLNPLYNARRMLLEVADDKEALAKELLAHNNRSLSLHYVLGTSLLETHPDKAYEHLLYVSDNDYFSTGGGRAVHSRLNDLIRSFSEDIRVIDLEEELRSYQFNGSYFSDNLHFSGNMSRIAASHIIKNIN